MHHPALSPTLHRVEQLQQFVVTADQMRAIEARVFAAGMPVAALMEKVGGLLARRLQDQYPVNQYSMVGILVGPGHNGGDALVIARELHFRGYAVQLYQPFAKLKDLTSHHAHYAASLGIPVQQEIAALQHCDVLVDGLFGFGLGRSLSPDLIAVIDQINTWSQPVVSIDLPSGIHTDTGAVLGTAVQATQTYCLGLWKRAFFQDASLDYLGTPALIDFDLPLADICAVLGEPPVLRRITRHLALSALPLSRPQTAHKYQMGHVLLICGSQQYLGAAILTGLGSRASGVGMVSIAVPAALKPLVVAQLPEALVIGCPEDASGALASLPDGMELKRYDAIACGPGLTLAARPVIEAVLASSIPLLLDADGLNILAKLMAHNSTLLAQRSAPTVLTPHLGEFKRLFPALADGSAPGLDRITAVQTAAQNSGCILLLKGAKTVVASPSGRTWLNPDSTPALARGGSGDVLTGLLGGLIAQTQRDLANSVPAIADHRSIDSMVASAAWWHAQAGRLAVRDRTVMGVDPVTLTQFLLPVLAQAF